VHKRELTVAAVQMTAKLGAVEANRRRAGELARRALAQGAELVMLPEFFTSAVAFHPLMLSSPEPLEGPSMAMLKELAESSGAFVGGSYLAVKGSDVFNTFVLAMPDGGVATHDKDQPTMWENATYCPGHDEGLLETQLGTLGAALCWELVRTRTVRRLRGKVNLLVGGSCWWTVACDRTGRPRRSALHRANLEIYRRTPATMARLLGVPVVHAAHAGRFESLTPFMPGSRYQSFFLGDTQIVDASGKILAMREREKGEGIVVARVELGEPSPSMECPDRFWIPDMPMMLRIIWHAQNWHGRHYYQRMKRQRKIPSLLAEGAVS